MKKFIGVLLVTSFMICPMVYAKEGSSASIMKHEQREKRIEEVYDQLHLTAEQKSLLQENKAKNRAKRQGLYEARRSLKEVMNQELMKPEIDMKKIGDLQMQVKALLSQIEDNRLSSILEVRNIFTVEQFSEFITMMEKLRQEKQNKSDD